MLNFKSKLAKIIAKNINIDESEILEKIEIPKDKEMADYAFPCFSLSKILKKAPNLIAEEIRDKIEENNNEESIISNIEAVNGFLNFSINKEILSKEVTEEFNTKKENFGTNNEGKGKKIIIDYSHPNIAKPFHIGHLRSTVIGQALYNTYEYLGYDVKGLNYLGDYGTQFGKMIEGYKRWGSEYNIDENPIEELTKMYVRINALCKEDENVLEQCRENFKKLEDEDEYCVEIWKKFKELSLKEFQKIYDILGGRFDSWDGEAFIAPRAPETIKKLEESGKVTVSQGAKIVDLEDKGIDTPCIILKSNGSTTYASRDLAAIIYRAETYDYDKSLYITSYEQILHFKQVFEVAKYLGLDDKYTKGLTHVPFGMILLKTGKMSTREGNMIKLEELLQEAIDKSRDIIEQKNPNIDDKEDIAKKVGVGAVIFNDLSNNRIKDEIFDWDIMLNFNGETGPYLQYTCVRAKRILEKAGYIPNIQDINISLLQDKDSIKIIEDLYTFNDVLNSVIQKDEPSILSRYLINLAEDFSTFYNNNHVLDVEKETQDARLYLTYMVSVILEKGLNILGIQVPNQM